MLVIVMLVIVMLCDVSIMYRMSMLCVRVAICEYATTQFVGLFSLQRDKKDLQAP